MFRILLLVVLFLQSFFFAIYAQDSTSTDDPFSSNAFDTALAAGSSTDTKNKLEYLPGIFFVSEATGYSLTRSEGSGSDMRFYGKAFTKVTKSDIGSLYLGCNFNYFLYAAANGATFERFYQAQSVDPKNVSTTLSELHFSFDVKKLVFVRIGSQLLSWGASYFWSPEDFVNQQKSQASTISAVDIRTGKPGVRIHIPIQPANVFLFTDFSSVLKNGVVGNLSESVAQAWRVDAAISGVNIGTVGYVAKDKPAQIGFDATGNLLSADIYGETAFKFTDALNVAPDFSMSIGASKALGQEQNWAARGEFYYNDKGYGDTTISTVMRGNFTPLYSGKYYAYAEISGTKFLTSILGVGLFGYMNLADLSYSSTLQLNFDIPGVLPFSVYGRYFGGRDDREFTSAFGGEVVQGGVRVRGEF